LSAITYEAGRKADAGKARRHFNGTTSIIWKYSNGDVFDAYYGELGRLA
jgi:hypothetical protein